MKVATVSSKKQVTLNNDLLAHLGLSPKGQVTLEKVKEGVLIKPMKKSIVEQTAGSLRKYINPKLLKVSEKRAKEGGMQAMVEHISKEGLE